MIYTWKVRSLKIPRVNWWWRYLQTRRGRKVGHYDRLPELVRSCAGGGSFADIGCMWGVNGAYAFAAEKAGATRVVGVDVFGPTPEFETERAARGSSVQFILGDATAPETLERIGVVDTVLCAGVLYHHPSPFDLMTALRRICRKTLILRTATIPMLDEQGRRLWNLESLGLQRQAGITDAFNPRDGYRNWFWGMTPSCLTALVTTAGFRVDRAETEAFAQTFVCTPVAVPFAHRFADESEARAIAAPA
jgi:SAM-dependent methyltransferase